MEKIVSRCKRRGFIFQSGEIYGGLNGAWDMGPLGVELKRNLKDYWWRVMVRERDDVVGLDGSILMNRAVWKASGHEETFSDPMVDCRTCKARRPRCDGCVLLDLCPFGATAVAGRSDDGPPSPVAPAWRPAGDGP